MRSISLFRKDLIFKQLSLYETVASLYFDEPKEQDQEFIYEELKNESEGNVEIKVEAVCENDYELNTFSPEYVEEEENLYETEQFAEESLESKQFKRVGGSKKIYKRALCGLCGNSYCKDQLQRHIDVSFLV